MRVYIYGQFVVLNHDFKATDYEFNAFWKHNLDQKTP